jgi:hypothetical protein
MQDQLAGTESGSSGLQHNRGREPPWGFVANIVDTPCFEYQDGLCFIWLQKCNVASLRWFNPGKLLTPILQIVQQEAAFHRGFKEQGRNTKRIKLNLSGGTNMIHMIVAS